MVITSQTNNAHPWININIIQHQLLLNSISGQVQTVVSKAMKILRTELQEPGTTSFQLPDKLKPDRYDMLGLEQLHIMRSGALKILGLKLPLMTRTLLISDKVEQVSTSPITIMVPRG